VHIEVLRKYSDFFSAQLSERWKGEDLTRNSSVSIVLKDCGDLQAYTVALKLLYRIEGQGIHLLHGVDLFAGVKDAANCMRVADRLQIKVLQEAALGYLEGIPWQGEEAVFVQEACQSVGFPTDALQKCLLQDGLSIASRQIFLKSLLENVGSGADNILTLAKEILREGTIFRDRSVVIEVLENQSKVLITNLMDQVKNLWDLCSDNCFKDHDTVLGRIWVYANFKIEAGFTISDIVHLLKKCTSTSVMKPYFHGLGQRKLRNAFQRQLYQHLVAAARRGRPVLGHDCRAKLLSLWTPAFETDDLHGKRESPLM
jgi:hypothetical protein